MLGNSIRLFRVAGIDVGVHVSWLVIFVLVTWSLAVSVFPTIDGLKGQADAFYWLLGAVTAILLFTSVVVHELAHSLVAKRMGLGVKSITLFIFGGVSNLTGEAKRPSTEFTVAIVGPLSSLAIAGIAFVVGSVLDLPVAVSAVLSYLVYINVALGLFNLIPGFPLDGGRVFRSIVWNATGSMRRGTEVAVFVSNLVSWGLFLIAAWLILVDGNLFNGIWFGAIGWFLQNAANAQLQQVRVEQRLQGARVADVVEADATVVSPNTSVLELIDDYFLRGNRRAIPVGMDDRLVGMVTVRDVHAVPKDEWAATRVADVMGGRDGLVTVSSRSSLQQALEALAKGDYEQVPVVDDGRFVGVVSRADIVRQIQLREALDVEGALPGAARGEPTPGEAA